MKIRRFGVVLVLLLSGCALPFGSTPPPATAQPTATPATPAPSAPVIGSTRTVLAQLGLNIHATESTSAAVVAVAAQGTTLTVLAYDAANGGWYQVRGQTVTGWIVADPTLTAPGQFVSFQSSSFDFSVLYPQSWTFEQQAGGVVFKPQQGQQISILVRTAATPSAFQSAPNGYISTYSEQLVVCGYTGTLDEYQLASGAQAPTPALPGATMLPDYASIVLTFDPVHAMQISFNYTTPQDLTDFDNFYNSISVPFSLCQKT